MTLLADKPKPNPVEQCTKEKAMDTLLKLAERGQSYWLDNLARHKIQGGDLHRRACQEGLRGVT